MQELALYRVSYTLYLLHNRLYPLDICHHLGEDATIPHSSDVACCQITLDTC